jgi:hypothetical protein
MSGEARYLWGDTKVDYVSFKPRSTAPGIKSGRMYFDSTYGFKFCNDGTCYTMIRDVLHN